MISDKGIECGKTNIKPAVQECGSPDPAHLMESEGQRVQIKLEQNCNQQPGF